MNTKTRYIIPHPGYLSTGDDVIIGRIARKWSGMTAMMVERVIVEILRKRK